MKKALLTLSVTTLLFVGCGKEEVEEEKTGFAGFVETCKELFAGDEEEEPKVNSKAVGREITEAQIDLVDGGAEAMADKGEDLGTSIGEGMGNLLQGIGAGFEESFENNLNISPSEEMIESGVTIVTAEESYGNQVKLALKFRDIYKGRVILQAFTADSIEIGRATSEAINQPENSLQNMRLQFHTDMDMSDIDHCSIMLISTPTVDVVYNRSNAPTTKITLGQMHETGTSPLRVSQYIIFNNAFSGSIQLRAFDATDAEIGRSQSYSNINKAEDVSATMDFTFHQTLAASSVRRFELHAKPM